MGRRIDRNHLSISYLRGDDGGVRVAFLVGKRVGKAVVRNKVRRRLREIVRQRGCILPPGVLLCIIVSPSAGRLSFQELEKDLVEGFKKLRKYEENYS